MTYGKLIELFLVNGTAESLIIAELANWNGKAIKIPRIEIRDCDRKELEQAGVYFLFCKEDDETDSVYIGEAENIKERLKQHIHDFELAQEKYYWHTAVVFVGRDLNKALIRYLENRLVQIARENKRYKVLTKKTYQNTVIKDSQQSAMEEFIDIIRILINTLGYKVLEPLIKSDSDKNEADDIFSINNGVINAKGKATSEGFVVLKGSVISDKIKSSLHSTVALKRKELINNGIIDDESLTFTKDYLFTSPSFAAGIVRGYSANGRCEWKNDSGITLKDVEKKEE